jgi:hypothetical protein
MDIWNILIRMSGEDCYTITQKRPAVMNVDMGKVTIIYPSGRSLNIGRDMIEEAYNKLVHQGTLTIGDAFDITGNKDRTDRIMAVLAMLQNVTSTSSPRELHY